MSWSMKPLGTVAKVIPGFAFKSKDLGGNGIPVIKIGSILDSRDVVPDITQCFPDELFEERHKKYKLYNGDILLAMTGATAGKAGRIHCKDNECFLLNQRVAKIVPETIHPDFLWIIIGNDKYRSIFYGLGGGAAQPNMSGTQIESVEIPCPDYKIQERIASILSAYDDLIENNRRRIQLLEESARLLYKEWFVRLRFPGHEHVKVVDGVPEGWKRKLISETCETVGGGTPKTKVLEYWGDEITWVVPTDVTRNNCLYLMSSERSITEKGLRESSAKMVPPYTILMTSRASVGYFAMMDRKMCTNQGFINVIPKKFEHKMYYLFNLMSRVEEIRGNAKGTTYPEISKGRFRSMEIMIPSSAIISEFCIYAENIFKQICWLKKQIEKTIQARDLLLPRLMNGEVHV